MVIFTTALPFNPKQVIRNMHINFIEHLYKTYPLIKNYYNFCVKITKQKKPAFENSKNGNIGSEFKNKRGCPKSFWALFFVPSFMFSAIIVIFKVLNNNAIWQI